MAPDVRARKLAYLRQLIDDLAPYAGASQTQIEADHYKVERLFELEEIDYEILRASIEPAVRDFSEFTAIFAQDL